MEIARKKEGDHHRKNSLVQGRTAEAISKVLGRVEP